MDELNLEIKRMIVSALDLEDIKPEEIGDDMPLFGDGLGLDSIDALELGIALRKKYRLRFEANDDITRKHFRCVASLAELVRSQRAAG